MFATSKIKWFGSIIFASFLIALALTGGNWGTNYAAGASINANPIINEIFPSKVPAGSPNTVIVVSGSGFGDVTNTGVRLLNSGYDNILHPIQVYPDALSVTVPDTLLTVPTTYILSVVRSTYPSVPTIPLIPAWDVESNSLPFVVFQAKYLYLPIVTLNAMH
jgi:hypothetical protein